MSGLKRHANSLLSPVEPEGGAVEPHRGLPQPVPGSPGGGDDRGGFCCYSTPFGRSGGAAAVRVSAAATGGAAAAARRLRVFVPGSVHRQPAALPAATIQVGSL